MRSTNSTTNSEGEGGTTPAIEERHESHWPLCLVLALHLLVALPLAWVLNFWVDEAFTIHTTSGSLVDAFRRAIDFEQQAPLYFVALRLFRFLDSEFVFTRTFSVLATTALLVVAARISRRLFPRAKEWWIPGILAVHPGVIGAAVETRVYALALLIAACIVLGFVQTTSRLDPRPLLRRGGVLIGAAIAALYTQYYLGFLLAALGIALVLLRRREDVKRYVIAMVVVAIAAVPAFMWAYAQTRTQEGIAPEVFTNRGAIGYLLYVFSESLVPGYGFIEHVPSSYALGSKAIAWILRGAFAVATFIAVRRAAQVSSYCDRSAFGAIAVAFVVSAVAFAAIGRGVNLYLVDLKRYWSFLPLLGAFLLLPVLLGLARGDRERTSHAVVAVILVEFGLLIANHHSLAKQGDCERVASYITAREGKGEPIVVFPNELALPLALYYHGSNRLAPVPRDPDLVHYDPRTPRIESMAQLEEFFARLEGDEIWIVSNPRTDSFGIRYNTELLYLYLAEHFTVLDSAKFFKEVDVQHLRRRR